MSFRKPYVVMLALLVALVAPAAAQQTGGRALDVANLDTTCAPCRDFYQWSNGGWLARNPVPAAYSVWGSFDELREKNQAVLRTVLDEAARGAGTAPAGSNSRKLGVFYETCMDSTAAERAGSAPIADALARISRISSPAALQTEVTRLQAMGLGGMFGFSAQQDSKNSTRVIAVTSQGGLGLPDRDYYTRTDSASRALRAAYQEHVARMLVLTGESQAQAADDSRRVMALETALANASMTRVAQRDPNATYHKMSVAEVQAITPNWQWASYLRDRGARGVDSINVRQPEFFRAMNGMLTSVPLADWKAYLRWHLARSAAPALSNRFSDESFRMQAVLTGTREQLPRWKRCLATTDAALGEALGQAYVERTFTPEAKARAVRMVDNLAAALRDRLGGLEWMTDTTRTQALAKLEAFRNKIGYPDRWRDYSALQIQPGSHLANLMRVSQFASARNLAKIGQPVDRAEWGMTPPTVNAYYSPSMNEIVFPAGILQPPFFDPNADDAVNYGGMGAVIGHEMTHGFDDQGRQFDARGNLRDWWQPQDAAAYTEQAGRVADQFSAYTVVDTTVHVNGRLTLGENIADLGGLTIAYHALQKELAGKPRTRIDGYTPEQRFFMAWAQIWRRNSRPEALRLQVATDPHSPGQWRTNGPLSNMPEFAEAFGCHVGDPMVRAENVRARIW